VYTNTYGKPIELLISANVSSADSFLYINNVNSGCFFTNSHITLTAIIPVGYTYHVTLSSNSAILHWLELK